MNTIRTAALEHDGEKQITYTKSNDGWMKTVFVLEGRALDKILLPWCLVSLNAIAWTVASEEYVGNRRELDFAFYESLFGLVLSSSLSFLLVFRLNRSAERYWSARMSWGIIIASSRTLVEGVLVHGRHDPKRRDEVVRWIAAFSIILTHFIRGIQTLDPGTLLGILRHEEIENLNNLSHAPLHATQELRLLLDEIFYFDDTTPFGVAQGRSQRLDALEKELNILILQMGALERIKASPLPLVYVTHLRTFLLCFLLGLPYIWAGNLGYATIPMTILTAFALLGLEGAATEVEAPFEKDRTNHLNMDAYCIALLKNITQQIQQDADRAILNGRSCTVDRKDGMETSECECIADV